MNVNFAHVCDYALLDAGGKPSVIGIFDQFNVEDFSKPLPPFFFFFEIGFSRGELDRELSSEVRLVTEDGKQVFGARSTFRLNSAQLPTNAFELKAPQILHLRTLKLPGPGTYVFSIFLAGAHNKDLAIRVHQAPPALPKGA